MSISKHKYVIILRPTDETVRVLKDIYIDYKPGIIGFQYRNERADVTQIDDKVWRMDSNIYTGAGIWSTDIMVFNMEHPLYMQDMNKFGFEENIKICWSNVINFEYFQKDKDLYTPDEIYKILLPERS